MWKCPPSWRGMRKQYFSGDVCALLLYECLDSRRARTLINRKSLARSLCSMCKSFCFEEETIFAPQEPYHHFRLPRRARGAVPEQHRFPPCASEGLLR